MKDQSKRAKVFERFMKGKSVNRIIYETGFTQQYISGCIEDFCNTASYSKSDSIQIRSLQIKKLENELFGLIDQQKKNPVPGRSYKIINMSYEYCQFKL